MKKTLITLLTVAATALSANAASWGDSWLYSENGTTITLDTAQSSLTAVVVLDVEKMKDVMLAGASLSKNTLIDFIDTDTNDIGLQTNYSSADGKIANSGLYGTWNQGGAYSVGMNSGFELSTLWDATVAASAVLTYSYSTGTTAAFSALKSDGSMVTLGGTWNTTLRGTGFGANEVVFDANLVEKSFVFNGVSTVEQATYLATTVIPEPATATLSLLALAGLAARRRRK